MTTSRSVHEWLRHSAAVVLGTGWKPNFGAGSALLAHDHSVVASLVLRVREACNDHSLCAESRRCSARLREARGARLWGGGVESLSRDPTDIQGMRVSPPTLPPLRGHLQGHLLPPPRMCRATRKTAPGDRQNCPPGSPRETSRCHSEAAMEGTPLGSRHFCADRGQVPLMPRGRGRRSEPARLPGLPTPAVL